jgi:hypothetical protein
MKAYLEIAALTAREPAAPDLHPTTPMSVVTPAVPKPAVIMPRQAATGLPSAEEPTAVLPAVPSMATAPTPAAAPAIADQADGLRKLFNQAPLQCVALMANPFVVWSGVALERLAQQCQALGRQVLVVDAADTSPQAPESAALGLSGCIDRLPSGAFYVAARGLPRAYVDTRGGATRLLDELTQACPQADTLVVHAEMTDLARIFKGRNLRPLLIAADQVDSLKHAYAGWKLLAQRCAWLTADLMLLASLQTVRSAAISGSLAQTADRYFGGLLVSSTVLDPMDADNPQHDQALLSLVQGQLQLPPQDTLDTAPAALTSHRAHPSGWHNAGPFPGQHGWQQPWQERPEPTPGLWA